MIAGDRLQVLSEADGFEWLDVKVGHWLGSPKENAAISISLW